MKKEIGELKSGSGKKKKSGSSAKPADGTSGSAGIFRMPTIPDGVRKFLGPKPVIRYSHSAALKIFENLGFKFEVRHLGDSRLGLFRWPLRKVPAGTAARRVLMVPGFGDTPLSWWSVLAAMKPVLKRKADEVIIIDYPGYSGFLHDQAAFDSMDELIRVFRDVIDTLKPEIIIGHSLGGWLGADYAIERPEIVKELILVDPGGLVMTEEDRANYRGLFERAVKSGSKDLLPHVFAKAPILLPFFQEEFFSFLLTDEAKAFVQSFADRHLLNGRVAKIRANTTVIWGEHDTLTPSKWIDQWLEQLPNDRKKSGIIVRGSGHSPQVEKPGVMIALLTQIFLDRPPKNLALLPFWKVLGPRT